MAVQMIEELLKEYRRDKCCSNPVKIIFHGVDGFDVYNPTAVFEYKNKQVICARVEKRDSEHSKAIFFYEKEANHFYPLEGVEKFELQDPYITKIGDLYVFGGTEIYTKPEEPNRLFWHAKFYSGKRLEELTMLVEGPDGMKDIRIVELANKTIGVFSRPQGEKGGRGKIGFTVVNTLSELTTQAIEEAPLLDLFDSSEWGGVNEPILLKNDCIGVLGHIAKFTEGDVRHYYPAVFFVNPITREYTNMQIIAERSDFLEGPSKRDDLQDVLFSGGLVANDDVYAELYVGVSDCEVQKITIKNPFLVS